ncbi:MAG: hypothetical protein FWD61_09895 [Phycisphaerales bacterium]|nr:hypothetical protein [Phycisphaerales bacterium]
MIKANIKVDLLRKTISRLVKAAPSRRTASTPSDPIARLILAFLEYDCDEARASNAERKFLDNMVDYNELRVTPAIELAALLGVRYPFAESRCSALHRTLQSIFDREHQMRLDRLKEMKKTEIRPYFQSLAGITPYVEAAVCLDAFTVPAAPIDTKLLLWLISKEVLPEGTELKTAQQVIEKHLKAAEAADFFHGSRKELDGWSPKSWPQVAKAYSPILAPPPIEAPAPVEDPKKDPKKPEPAKDSKPKPVATPAKKK